MLTGSKSRANNRSGLIFQDIRHVHNVRGKIDLIFFKKTSEDHWQSENRAKKKKKIQTFGTKEIILSQGKTRKGDFPQTVQVGLVEIQPSNSCEGAIIIHVDFRNFQWCGTTTPELRLREMPVDWEIPAMINLIGTYHFENKKNV